jgi:hypothetical protein
MSKAVAKELIDATPAKLRSEFMSQHRAKNDKPGGRIKNARRKRNFLGFGAGSKVMSSSRLSKDAYNQGYLGRKDFDKWLASKTKTDNLHSSAVRDLRRQFDQGNSDRLAHEQGKAQLALLKQQKREGPKAPPIPKGEKASDLNEEYKGLTIRRTQTGFEVKGETWNTLKQAKEYADYWIASGGKIGTRRNPKTRKPASKAARAEKKPTKPNSYTQLQGDSKQTATIRKLASRAKVTFAVAASAYSASGGNLMKAMAVIKDLKRRRNSYTHPRGSGEATLTQGKSKAQVFETGTNKHTAEIITGSGAREEHSFSGPGSFRAAMSWARLRLHEVANPGNRFKVYALTPNRKKNPAEPSARMYEKFHGTPSTEVREYTEQVHRHSWLAGMGPLISIKVRSVSGNREAELEFPDPQDAKVGDVVMLSTTEDGTQLICTGGDQELDPKSLIGTFGMLPVDFNRDNVLIGTITEITYRTKKTFEKDGKEEIDFYHALGSEGSRGIYPVLIYHPRNPSLEIAGGRYYIGKAEKSLGNVSPGVIG